MTHDADGEFAEFVVLCIRQSLRGSDDDALAGVDAERVKVLHVADGDAVVKAVAHHLIFHLFPAFQTFLNQNLRREGEGFFCQTIQLFFVVAESGAETAERVGGTEDDGIAETCGSIACLLDGFASLAADGFDTDFVEFFHEEFTVFGVHDGLNGRAEHLKSVFFKHSVSEEFHAAVQRGLSAEGKHDALRFFLFNDTLDEIGGDRKEVDVVSHSFGGLHGGDVGIDEDGFDAFFLESLEGLGTGIVKLSCLANFQSAGTKQQNFLYC